MRVFSVTKVRKYLVKKVQTRLFESQPGADTEANVSHIPKLDDPITEQEVRQTLRNLKQGN